MKKYLLGIFCLVLTLGLASVSYADRRSYVWTYEYMTMPKGMWELEYYLTDEIPATKNSNIYTLKHWLELEYGITDNWDISMYQMYKYKNKAKENDSKYDGFKVRTRYRFGKKGQFVIDPLVYLEYIRDSDFSKPSVIEAKLILGKDIGSWNVSYNQIIKRDLERTGKTALEYAGALGYAVFPNFKVGVETKGNYGSRKYALGPTISWAGKKIWASLGAAFGVNTRTDDIQTRIIVGVPF